MAHQENLADQETDIGNNDAVGQGRGSWFTDHAQKDSRAIMTERLPFVSHDIWRYETGVQLQILMGSVRTILLRKLMQLACFLLWSIDESKTPWWAAGKKMIWAN